MTSKLSFSEKQYQCCYFYREIHPKMKGPQIFQGLSSESLPANLEIRNFLNQTRLKTMLSELVLEEEKLTIQRNQFLGQWPNNYKRNKKVPYWKLYCETDHSIIAACRRRAFSHQCFTTASKTS